jgi:hypothetical protein
MGDFDDVDDEIVGDDPEEEDWMFRTFEQR